jgi:tetratricopeptide (TPR) repeat protein
VYFYLRLILLVAVNLAVADRVHPQATNQAGSASTDPFAISSITLTGSVLAAPPASLPQAMAELKQKVQLSMAAKDYETTLNYATIGLRANPLDVQLLTAKAIALTKLDRLPAAIATLQTVLAVETNDMNIVNGLAELLLITNRTDDYRALVSKYKPQIETAYGGVVTKYFSVLEAYQTESEDKFRGVVTQALSGLPAKQGSLLPGWEFDDVLWVLSHQPASPKKGMLLTFVRVLAGEVSRDEALKTIKSL